MDITFRPRLTKGRHLQTVDEYGPFCLVEAVGFNVDGKVDDSHASVDTALAALARTLNDRMCAHYSHPIAEAAGVIAPSAEICDDCQGRLWAVGERIAETGYAVANWSEDQRAALHVRLAVEAAEAVFKLITRNTELWRVVRAALDAAEQCLLDPSPNNRAAARIAASRVDGYKGDGGNNAATWAAHAAGHATRAAAAVAGDNLDEASTSYIFANRRAVEAITYALGAVAGDRGRSMGVARRVLNAFGKATSQKATPGESSYVPMGNRAAYLAAAELRERAEAEHHGCQECAAAELAAAEDADRVDAGFAYIVDAPISLGGPALVTFPDDAGAAAADAAEPQHAEAAYREAYAEAEAAERRERNLSAYYSGLAPCAERTTVDGIGYGCVKLGEHVEHNTALGAAWWTAPEEYAQAVADDQLDAAAAAELEAVKVEADDAYAAAAELADVEERAAAAKAAAHRRQVAAWMDVPVWAITPVETPTEEYQVVDEFEESELADVADEAIGDVAALDDDLQRAEAMLTAIAAEHRPVAAWTRRRHDGVDVEIEYQTDCCVSCRDVNGNPVPAPCRTMVIVNSYGEA